MRIRVARNQTLVGVLVMAYGGPGSIEEIPGYLADIRSGRVTTPRVLEEIRNNYERIGGKSPLLEITRKQADEIRKRSGDRFRFYVGMRHWSPWIEETVGEMIEDSVERAISLVMAPHYSELSIAKYQAKIAAGLEMYRGDIEFAHIDSYHDAEGFIEALKNRVVDGVESWPPGERENVHVIFSAHSLPERIVAAGDPYPDQLSATARLVAARAGLPDERWSWSYQSAGRSPEPWLRPALLDHLDELAGKGINKVVSVPVGFVSDHVEILYDIDILARERAKKHNMRLVRPPAINTDPLFVDQIAKLVTQRAKNEGWID